MPFYNYTAGEVSISSDVAHWIIPDFYGMPQEKGIKINSPCFRLIGQYWYLTVYPNGHNLLRWTWGWFGIKAFDKNNNPNILRVRIGILGADEKNFVESRSDSRINGSFSCFKLLPTSFLKSRRDHLVPGGNLHVFFFIENDDPAADTLTIVLAKEHMDKWFNDECKTACIEATTQTDGETVDKCFKDVLETTCIEATTQTDGETDKWFEDEFETACIQATTQTDEETIDKCSEDEFKTACIEATTQTVEETGIGKMDENLKESLLNRSINDVVLKVQDQEFRSHRCILTACAPALLTILMHDTKEKITDVVDIKDIDCSTFPDFLSYLYTGSVENTTSESSVKLYTIADKYKMKELKKSCMEHILANISVDNFCDVLNLAHRHNNEDLMEACTHFFTINSLDIIMSSKWQTFLNENPTVGNDLFIKHVQLKKNNV